MLTIRLYGIAEGITGLSSIRAGCISDALLLYPELNEIKGKLRISNTSIGEHRQCDG